MHYLITAIAFLIIFSVLILIHELGHFVMAKRAGIKVEEFGFGLPPRIWGKKKGETIYSVNWIPFGGFVRMLGEDAKNKSVLSNKKSFASKSVGARMKVVTAGVIMNFFLAWLFLTIGFSFGMQPLLLPEEILPAINEGVITLEQGAKVKQIDEVGLAHTAGIKPEDIIYSINGTVLDSHLAAKINEAPAGLYTIYRDGNKLSFEVAGEGEPGIEFYDYADFPRVKVFSIEENSTLFNAGVRQGDIIITLNDNQVFDIHQYEEIFRKSDVLNYVIYRDGQQIEFSIKNRFADKVIASKVYQNTPAAKVGLKDGDIIVSIEGIDMHDPVQMVKYVENNYERSLAVVVDRGGEILNFTIQPQDKKMGVLVSVLNGSDKEDRGVSFYNVDVLSSAVSVEDEKYPFYVSAYKSFSEMWKISKVTAVMFMGMISDILFTGEVPDSVAGPVGIAQMTFAIVGEGLIVILRFMALLSLSLAVINILPLPALDGGRFLFLLFEAISGRRVNQKWETIIHTVGYILIILLILTITYSDIVRIVKAW